MQLPAFYLIAQGSAGFAWWLTLALVPSSRAYFAPPGAPDWAILSFWLADLLFFVCGSLLCGFAMAVRSPRAQPLLLLTVGGTSYATLYCVGASLMTGSMWLPTGVMVASPCVTVWIASQCDKTLKR